MVFQDPCTACKGLPKEMLADLKPEAVVPLAMWMCHESSGCNGEIIECGGGWFSKIRVQRAKGAYVKPTDGNWAPEDVQKNWEKVVDFTDAEHPTAIQQSVMAMMGAINSSKL